MVSVENDGRLSLCNYYKISHIWYEVWPSIQGHLDNMSKETCGLVEV